MDNISISISQLKVNPSEAISKADDYPMSIENRGKITGYLVGKDFFEGLLLYLEDLADKKAVKEINFKNGRSFEEVARELNI